MGARASRPRRVSVSALPPIQAASLASVSAGVPDDVQGLVTLAASNPIMTYPSDGDALHERTIKSVCVSGGHVFCGSWDHTASMWELESGEFVRSFHGHRQDVIGITVHGGWLFTCGDCVRMWDTRTGDQVAALGSKDEMSTATFYAALPDPVAVGLIACAFCRGAIHIYDFTGPADNFVAQRAQTSRPSVLYGARPLLVLDGHSAGVMGLATGEARGEHVLASASIDKTAKLWSIRRGCCLCTFVGHEAPLRDVRVALGRVYTASLDLTAREWDPLSARCTRVFGPHLSPVRSLLVVGHTLITAEAPNTAEMAGSCAVREFDVRTGEQRACHTGLHDAGIFHLYLLREEGAGPAGRAGRGAGCGESAEDADAAAVAQRYTLLTASQDCFVKRWRLIVPPPAGAAAGADGGRAAEGADALGEEAEAGLAELSDSSKSGQAGEHSAGADAAERARRSASHAGRTARRRAPPPPTLPPPLLAIDESTREGTPAPLPSALAAPALSRAPADGAEADGAEPAAVPAAREAPVVSQLPPEIRRVVEETRAKIEELEESARCFVCLERPKNAAFVPCGHQACRRCAENFRHKKCAICRAGVSGILALYG